MLSLSPPSIAVQAFWLVL